MKKYKRILLTIIFLFATVLSAGCKDKVQSQEEIYLEFKKNISKIQSYTCTANVVAINNKSENTYTINHTYRKPSYYKLEIISPKNLEGKVIEYTHNKIIIKNKQIEDTVELPNDKNNRQYLFIGDFIEAYLKNKAVNLRDSNDLLALEADLSGSSSYYGKQILYIDKKTKNPKKMEIIDKESNKKFIVEYTNFNCKD